jgi:D-3-phosphoglycerate dehydrogenase
LKVLITRNIPQVGLKLLQEHFEIEFNDTSRTLSRNELKNKIKDVDAVLCLLTDQIDQEIIDAALKLKVISNHAVGYDNVDVPYATRKRIAVTNTPDVLTDATADFTFTLLLSVARNVVIGDEIIRKGEFRGWDPLFLLGADIVAKTLGIIGAGRIGTAVAERSAGWNMNIVYFDSSTNHHLEEKFSARKVSLETLLEESDFVSIHLSLSKKTTHLIGKKELEMMKTSAYLINTARGAIIDEKALVQALREKKIAGAALDVYENEPALADGLAGMKNAILAPHIGSATIATRNKMSEIAAKNIVNILKGGKPVSIVNPEVLKIIPMPWIYSRQ